MAANDDWNGNLAMLWLMFQLKERAKATRQCLDEESILNQIRVDLATAYADMLSQSARDAAFPTINGVIQFHWDVFAKFGLPRMTFGGTPWGSSPIWTKHWCPNCL